MQFTKSQIDEIGRIAAHVSRLQDRCDAFFERRAQRDAGKAERKARRAARRDAEEQELNEQAQSTRTPWSPATFDDTHLASERTELRQGALSKPI